MNAEMAYLLGMILGNGEVQQDERSTRVTIDIPHKNLYTDDMREAAVYVRASLMDIQYILEPLLGQHLTHTSLQHSTKVSFEKPNDEYVMREILRLIGAGTHHSTMRMNEELFSISTDEKKALLRGVADVTGYIRKSNIAFGQLCQSFRRIPVSSGCIYKTRNSEHISEQTCKNDSEKSQHQYRYPGLTKIVFCRIKCGNRLDPLKVSHIP